MSPASVPPTALPEDYSPEQSEPRVLGHPPGLFLLFGVEMWERFSYYGMRALLVLYLATQMAPGNPDQPGFRPDNPGRGWSEAEAYSLYGLYTGLAYLLPVLGGMLADKLLGTHRSMLLGGILIALGHVVLAVSGLGELNHTPLGMTTFVTGLALIVIGTGYFKPTVSTMVGQLYRPGDPTRDGGFSIFYMGINLGAFLCAFVCGTLGEVVGWHWGFGSAAVGMILGLLMYIYGRPTFLKGIGEPPPGKPNYVPALLVASLGAALVAGLGFHLGVFGLLQGALDLLMSQPYAGQIVPLSVGLVVLLGSAWFVSIQHAADRGPVCCILIFILFNAFFWIAFEQAGSTLNIFAERSTARMLPLIGEFPATWFQSVNPLLIILLAPAFAWLWGWLGRRNLNPSQPLKIAYGLILLGIGYLFMVEAARLSATGILVAPYWLLATYLFHTLGELCLSPTGLSFVTKTAPARFVSLLMGLWFLSSFVANWGGGQIASQVKAIESGELRLPWQDFISFGGRADYFMLFVVTSIGAGLFILLLTPLLKRLLGSKVNA